MYRDKYNLAVLRLGVIENIIDINVNRFGETTCSNKVPYRPKLRVRICIGLDLHGFHLWDHHVAVKLSFLANLSCVFGFACLRPCVGFDACSDLLDVILAVSLRNFGDCPSAHRKSHSEALPEIKSVISLKFFGKPPRLFSYAELEIATGGFSQFKGGYGSLPEGQVVAVKQHKLASSQGDVEFALKWKFSAVLSTGTLLC
ncbi:hypothetical protein Bca101_062779 [Brassica carinata]